MRAAAIHLGLMLLLQATVAVAWTPSTSDRFDIEAVTAEKWAADRGGGIPNPIYVNVGGDDIGSATVIPGIPFSDAGNTCQFTHQYDAICPYNIPGAPDVVYGFTPSADINLTVALCASAYDTKLYVYENDVGNLIACNDDVCGWDGFKSEIECVTLAAGNHYFIVVDGWSSSDCGNYEIVVAECPPHIVHCPPGAVLEGEPDCENDEEDHYNAGCNDTPPAFTAIPCLFSPVTMCGTYGGFTYFGHPYRDTDWYFATTIFNTVVSMCVVGEYDTVIGIIDGSGGCPAPFYDYTFAAAGEEVCLHTSTTAGDWLFFVATSGFGPTAGECGGDYNVTFEEVYCDDVAVESASWGSIKNLYK